MSSEKQDVVQIEIKIDKLESLFSKGEICATEIRCLNCESKKCIWSLCLTSCARRMQCNIENFECYAYCQQSAEKLRKDSSVYICVKQEDLAKLA